VQTKSENGQKPITDEFKGTRVKRGLFKDNVLNKIWNADLNGAVNHLKIAFNSSFQWLQDYLFKLCNPIKFKSVSDFYYSMLNVRIAKQVKFTYQMVDKRLSEDFL